MIEQGLFTTAVPRHEYSFFNIGTKTYLVHDGCGPVLEFRNDSIVRIDKSFLHQNQYRAVRFAYNNEIYFYSGYGLFTYKNILTKYDFQTREWIEIKTFSKAPLETRENAYSYLIENDLYVFGGNTKDENKIQCGKQLGNTIWKLNLPTMKWSNEGEVNKFSKSDYLWHRLFSNNQEKIYIITDEINEIDPNNNSIKKFGLKFFTRFFSNYFEGDNIVCILGNEVNRTKYFAIIPIKTTKGKLLSTSTFITPLPIDAKIVVTLSILFCLCIIAFLIFRKKIKNKLKPFNGIVYNQKTALFFYKGKPITIFEEQENRLLRFLLEQNNQFVSLNDLNQLFENKGQVETISATVKRREQAVDGLLAKVSKIMGIEEQKLILERKNSEDKRIKDILILPYLLKKEI